jgi:hypothetical protein
VGIRDDKLPFLRSGLAGWSLQLVHRAFGVHTMILAIPVAAALGSLLGYLAARARYLPAREAAARLHAIAREVLDSGIVKGNQT